MNYYFAAYCAAEDPIPILFNGPKNPVLPLPIGDLDPSSILFLGAPQPAPPTGVLNDSAILAELTVVTRQAKLYDTCSNRKP